MLDRKLDRKKIIQIHEIYGFRLEKEIRSNVLAFSLKVAHFNNIDLINLGDKEEDLDFVFNEFTKAGYACTKRYYSSFTEVEDSLFDGFFSLKESRDILKKKYNVHTKNILSPYPHGSEYAYINTGYYLNGILGEQCVISEITSKLSESKPILFIIEAAAGFGKTCTAYEILKAIIDNNENKYIPLFSELSRNRQAKIFHYILLDEIDRNFRNLKSDLVKKEISKGNIPVILDGFDELLLSSVDQDADDKYESVEPMLDTISQLLTHSAKVILTSRRTAIFDGAEFEEWESKHKSEFDIYRIRLEKPTVGEWLSAKRFNLLGENDFPIEKLNNPVLLSYLRFISDEDFSELLQIPTDIVEKYLDMMCERERQRQDLLLDVPDQLSIMTSLAKHLCKENVVSESKERISELIKELFTNKLEDIRKLYRAEERPTLESLIVKLTNHALLDRSEDEADYIGFVNDFILGTLVVDLIIENDANEWALEELFIEPAVKSTIIREIDRKRVLWESLLRFSLQFSSQEVLIQSCLDLNDTLCVDLENNEVHGCIFENITLGINRIKNYYFQECRFSNIEFNLNNMSHVTFSGCEFYNCSFVGEESTIYEVNSITNDQDVFIKYLQECNRNDQNNSDPVLMEQFTDIDRYVLGKFWPTGRRNAFKHRHENDICGARPIYPLDDIQNSLIELKKKHILLVPDRSDYYELNFEKISEIRTILGK